MKRLLATLCLPLILCAAPLSSWAGDDHDDDDDHRYRHHIDEEEEEHFPDFERHLTDEDRAWMRSVFERRKREETAAAEVTPEKKEDAKE